MWSMIAKLLWLVQNTFIYHCINFFPQNIGKCTYARRFNWPGSGLFLTCQLSIVTSFQLATARLIGMKSCCYFRNWSIPYRHMYMPNIRTKYQHLAQISMMYSILTIMYWYAYLSNKNSVWNSNFRLAWQTHMGQWSGQLMLRITFKSNINTTQRKGWRMSVGEVQASIYPPHPTEATPNWKVVPRISRWCAHGFQ